MNKQVIECWVDPTDMETDLIDFGANDDTGLESWDFNAYIVNRKYDRFSQKIKITVEVIE